MCKGQAEVSQGPSWRIERSVNVWQCKVALSKLPELEVNAASLRLKLNPSLELFDVPIPEHALPVDPESTTCKFSKRRGELIVEWPASDKPALGEAAAEQQVAQKAAAEKAAAEKAAADKAAADKAAVDKAAADIAKKAASDKAAAAERVAAEKEAAQKAAAQKAAAQKASADKAAAEKAVAEKAAEKAAAEKAVAAAEKAAEAAKAAAEKAAAEKAAADKAAADKEAAVKADADKKVAGEATSEAASSSSSATADEWKARGNAAIKTGDHEAAITCYSSGIAIVGGDVEVEVALHSNRALCFSKLNRHQEAVDDANRCVELRPFFVKGYLRGAMALRALGKPAEAHALLRRAPNNAEADALAVEIRPEAEAAEKSRIETLPPAEKAKEEGNVLFKKGLFEVAVDKYAEALGLCEEPEGSLALSIRNNRAACYHQISDFTAVIRDTNFVLERDPRNFKALMRRMLALEPMERYEKALQDARAILVQDPRNEVANKVQHRLGKLVRDLSRASDSA